MRLLLVEDDKMIGESLGKALTFSAFAVDWVLSCKDAKKYLAAQNFDLMLLDLSLPDGSGIDLLRDIRSAKNSLPVIVITARDRLNDKILGLDAGADDYLVKPFDIAELEARIRSLMRRHLHQPSTELTLGDISLDIYAHEICCAGKRHQLSIREFAILKMLMEQPKRIFSKTEMEEKIYNFDSDIGSNTIEVYIHFLRKRLGKQLIRNIRGVGYTINPNLIERCR